MLVAHFLVDLSKSRDDCAQLCQLEKANYTYWTRVGKIKEKKGGHDDKDT
jgi:hypothetical protein